MGIFALGYICLSTDQAPGTEPQIIVGENDENREWFWGVTYD